MNLGITKRELVKALDYCSKVATVRAGLPILECVYVEADTDYVKFSATNLEQTISYKISCHGTGGEKFAVSCRRLLDYVKRLPNVYLDLSASDNKLTVKSPMSSAVFACYDADDYPKIPSIEGSKDAKSGKLKLSDIQRLAEVCSFCSDDTTRPILTGVSVKDGKMLATDGYRLAMSDIDTEFSGIIPGDFMRTLQSFTADADICWTDNMLEISSGNLQVKTRLIENLGYSLFGQVEKLLEGKYKTSNITLELDELVSAITTAMSVDNKENRIKITANADKSITVSSDTSVGTIQTTVVADVADELVDKVSNWNGKLLLSVLALCKSDDTTHSVTLMLSANNKLPPMFVDDNGYSLLVMPMQ